MASTVQVLVPDIGGFRDVDVIDVLVKAGQQIDKETPMITLETEKAAMDVPAPAAGRVAEIKVKKGDKVSEGSVILLLESSAAPSGTAQEGAPQNAGAPRGAAAAQSTPQAPPAAPAKPQELQAGRARPRKRRAPCAGRCGAQGGLHAGRRSSCADPQADRRAGRRGCRKDR